MASLYKAVGGRKVFIFFLLLLVNTVALFLDKFNSEFGNFCVMLYSVIVIGNVSSKFAGTKEWNVIWYI